LVVLLFSASHVSVLPESKKKFSRYSFSKRIKKYVFLFLVLPTVGHNSNYNMKRLFAAIKINPDKTFLNHFSEIQNRLKHERIKWVEDYNIHITLKFFGETEEAKIPEITQVLNEVASSTNAFSLSLHNLGIFGSSHDPRIVWVGIEPYANLESTMKLIRDKLEIIGYNPDRQNLVPHLTLGRIKFLKDKKLFQQIIDQNKNISSQEINVDRIILFESILKKEGPVYLALQTFQLKR
jgi:2'-5' RNA ligase